MIEAQFKVQLRLADFQFEHAQTLEEVQNAHAVFIETFNTTPPGRIAGALMAVAVDVLGWLRGRVVDPKRLRELFGRTEWLRTVNRYGFVSVQRFYLYAEKRSLTAARVDLDLRRRTGHCVSTDVTGAVSV